MFDTSKTVSFVYLCHDIFTIQAVHCLNLSQPIHFMEHWKQSMAALRSGESKYKALVQLIAADIESGRLKDGARLPPQRDVGLSLGISVQTVTNAYKDLERHGLIRCEVGRGSFVSRRATEQMASYMLDRAEHSLVDFSMSRIIHTPEHDEAWMEVCGELAREVNQPWMRECRPIAGLERHRLAGVEWLAGLGIAATPDRLLITNGASHGLFLALAAVTGAGDLVLCEQLSDHGVIGAAQALGFQLKGLDIDRYGIQPEHFEDMCASEHVKALVCTPNLNNPTSSVMPDSRRRAIAKIAQKYGVYVIEDDVYGPLMKERITPISSHIPDLAFYCTSFTKSVLTGLRTGYACVPKRMALRVDSILRVNSWMGTPLLAEVATRWIDNGTAARLIGLQMERLQARHAAIDRVLSEYIDGHQHNALSCWLNPPEYWPLDALAAELRNRNVAVTLPDPFMVRGTERPHRVRLCLGAECGEDRFSEAVGSIAAVFDQYPKINDFI